MHRKLSDSLHVGYHYKGTLCHTLSEPFSYLHFGYLNTLCMVLICLDERLYTVCGLSCIIQM